MKQTILLWRICAMSAIMVFTAPCLGSADEQKSNIGALLEPAIHVGYVEHILIPKVDAKYNAKLDTGALTSSIHAEIIELQHADEEADKSGYVVFTINTEDGVSNHIKKKLRRIARIKKKDGGFQERPVVKMTFCLAGALIHHEVNLANREDFNYDILVGRNMLVEGGLVVDSRREFTTKPNCDTGDGTIESSKK